MSVVLFAYKCNETCKLQIITVTMSLNQTSEQFWQLKTVILQKFFINIMALNECTTLLKKHN